MPPSHAESSAKRTSGTVEISATSPDSFGVVHFANDHQQSGSVCE